MNIFFIGSPWHAIVSIALAKKENITPNFIIEYANCSSLKIILSVIDTHNMSQNILLQVNQFVLSPTELAKEYHFFSAVIGKRNYNMLKKFGKTYCKHVNNVFFFNARSSITAAVVKHFHESTKLIKLEDGINDYLPFKFTGDDKWLRATFKLILYWGLTKSYLANVNLLKDPRLIMEYCVFPEKKDPVDTFKRRSYQDFKHEIEKTLNKVGTHEEENRISNENVALIIGQSLYEDKSASLEQEISQYISCIDKLNKAQIYDIHFKMHPRSSAEKQQSILKLEQDGRIRVLKGTVPVEVDIIKFKYETIIGMWSNPIIYGRRLFSTNTFSMMYSLINQPSARPLLISIHETLKSKFPKDYLELDFENID